MSCRMKCMHGLIKRTMIAYRIQQGGRTTAKQGTERFGIVGTQGKDDWNAFARSQRANGAEHQVAAVSLTRVIR